MTAGKMAPTEGWSKTYNGRTTVYVVLTSIMAASGGLMMGYDLGISGGVTSMPSFLQKFFPAIYSKEGTGNNYCKYNNQKLQLFTSSLYIAGLIATFGAGHTSRKFGRLFTMRVAASCFVIGTLICASAPALIIVIFGRVIIGIGIGFANQAVPLYLSEMAPANLRGGLNILFQLAVSSGIVAANLVNYGTSKIKGWGWRVALGGAGVPAILLAIGSIILMDSPNSLIDRGHFEKGKKVLQKVRGVEDVEYEYEDIVVASEMAKTVQHPYTNILKRRARPQLVIATLMQLFQQLTGINAIMFYAPALLRTLGFGIEAYLYSAVISGIVNVASTLVAVAIVDKVGRRKLLLEAGGQMFLAMLCISIILGLEQSPNSRLPAPTAKAVVVLIGIFVAGFSWSWGPLGWLIPSEIFPLETRSAGQSIIVAINLFFTFLIAQSFLSMLCIMEYGIFIFFLFWIVIMTMFVIFLLPETKGIPIEGMQHVWGGHWYWKRYIPEEEIKEQEIAKNDFDLSHKPHFKADGSV